MQWKKTFWILLAAYSACATHWYFSLQGTTLLNPVRVILFCTEMIIAAGISIHLRDCWKIEPEKAFQAAADVLMGNILFLMAALIALCYIAPNLLNRGTTIDLLFIATIMGTIMPIITMVKNYPSKVLRVWPIRAAIIAATPFCLYLVLGYTEFLIVGVQGLGSHC